MNKNVLAGVLLVAAASAGAATPVVSGISLEQVSLRSVAISYTLANAPAIVTLDLTTNGVSIGGVAINAVTGMVNRLVEEDGTYHLEWTPDPEVGQRIGQMGVAAAVQVWSVNDPPPYMALDLSSNSTCRAEYYASSEALPGGLLENPLYKSARMVFKRVYAKGVPWTMGAGWGLSFNARDRHHEVTLDSDYYLGVFEVTQQQWSLVKGRPAGFSQRLTWHGRPVESVSYYQCRQNNSNSAPSDTAAHAPPNPPSEDSFLGRLRTFTGVEVDLPTEAQWEFACRAGHGEACWGNGVLMDQTATNAAPNLDMPGRYKENGGLVDGAEPTSGNAFTATTPEHGTAIVGSYAPNSWGFYDMHGNVQELCLDWHEDDIAAYGGAGNTNGLQTLSGVAGSTRARRGGGYSEAGSAARSTLRGGVSLSGSARYLGLRVYCPLIAK